MNFEQFIAKLNTFNFTKQDGCKLIADDWSVTVSFDFNDEVKPDLLINCTVDVWHKGFNAGFWGCSNEEQINIIRVWFIKKCDEIRENKDEAFRKNTNAARQLFNEIN